MTRIFVSLLLFPALTSACSFMTAGGVHAAMQGATVSRNPLPDGSLATVPIAASRDGSLFRLITATDTEVCINGEMVGTADDFENARLTLRSFQTPDDNAAPTVESTSVKVLGTSGSLGPGGMVLTRTSFQSCFDNRAHIFTKDTRYLVVQPKPVGPFHSPAIGAWHFDDEIRTLR